MIDSGLVNSDPGADPLVGTVVEDTYQILSRIGKGGMGSVYRAHHLHLDRPVAIKVLRGQASRGPVVVQRFRQEARALNLLNHPNIVHCYAFGFHDDSCYLAMDLVDGTTLADEIAQHGTLSPERFRRIFSQVASALLHAHSNGIVHRDLKPENIMLLTEDGNEDVVKLVDFGIAKVLDSETTAAQQLTKTGAFMGSPLFMSPEQCRAETPDARSDIYSLGCVMYLAITGHAPFEGDSIVEIIHHQLYSPPPTLPKNVPPQLANLIYGCLEKLPENRPSGAADVLSDLERPDSASVKVRQPPRAGTRTPNKLVKKLTEHKIAVAAAAVLLAGSVGLSYYTRVESLGALRNTCDRLTSKQAGLVQSRLTNQQPYPPPTSPIFTDLYATTDELIKSRVAYANALLDQDQIAQAVDVAGGIDVDIKQQTRATRALALLKPATIDSIKALGERFINLKPPQTVAAASCLYIAVTAHYFRVANATPLHLDTLAEAEQAVSVMEEIHARDLDNACPSLQSMSPESSLQHRPDAYTVALQAAAMAKNTEKVKYYGARIRESIGDITQDRTCLRSQDTQGKSLLRVAQFMIGLNMAKDAGPFLNQAAKLCRLGTADPGSGAAQAGYLLAHSGMQQHLKKDDILKFVELSVRASQYHKRSELPALVLGAKICGEAGDKKGEDSYIKRALAAPRNAGASDLQIAGIEYGTYLVLAKSLAENGRQLEAQNCLQVMLLKLENNAMHSGNWSEYLTFALNCGQLYTSVKMTEQSRDILQRVVQTGIQNNCRPEAVTAELGLHQLHLSEGDRPGAIQCLDRALAIVERGGGPEPAPNLVAKCFHYRAAVQYNSQHYADCQRDAETGLAYLIKHPAPDTVSDQALLHLYAGVGCSRQKQYEAAVRHLYQARDLWHQLATTNPEASRTSIQTVSTELAGALRALGRESEAKTAEAYVRTQ